MPNKKITVIGAGHLGSALVRGLIKSGYPKQSITISNRDPQKAVRLVNELGVLTNANNIQAIEHAEIIVLAVKPQFMSEVCQEIAATVQKSQPLIISLAAVTELDNMALWLGGPHLGIVRIMTNTPMEFCKGISALFANSQVTPEQKERTEALFNAVGSSFWVDNELMLDKVTAAIGSAPAYVFLFMEALQKAAMSRGIPEQLAEQIALEVVSGSAELARHSGHSFAHLREGVTTPHGVTAHSLKELSTDAFFASFNDVYRAAEERIIEIKG